MALATYDLPAKFLAEWFNETRKNTNTYSDNLNYVVLNGQPEKVAFVLAHTITLEDYFESTDARKLLEMIYEWCTTKEGQWIRDNALNIPQWEQSAYSGSWPDQKYAIYARLAGPALTEWLIKNGADSVSAD